MEFDCLLKRFARVILKIYSLILRGWSSRTPVLTKFFFLSDVHGQTPLHYAALQGSRRSAELILTTKPETLNITDKNQVNFIGILSLIIHA